MNWILDQRILSKYGERVWTAEGRYKVFTNAAEEPSLSVRLFETWVHVETFKTISDAMEFGESLEREIQIEEAS